MDYHKRHVESTIQDLFRAFPVLTITGARQVGKTTLIQHLFADKLKSFTFDPVIDIADARRDPEFFLQNNPPPVFLDEIQYAPELLGPIKRLVDKKNANGLFILSGSQNLSMLKHISESLAGRTAIVPLFPFSNAEFAGRPDRLSFLKEWILHGLTPETSSFEIPQERSIYQQIYRGGYPKIPSLPQEHIPVYWESYLQTYIERDVRTVSNIGSLQTFGRFISLLAALTAQEINLNQLGRELGIERRTALAWSEVAQATFQWITLPAFTRNPVKRVAGKGKGHFTDTGFACQLLKISGETALQSHPMTGRLVESFIVLEVIKRIQEWPSKPALYHYRAAGGGEVDLVMELDGRLFLIEIKAGSRPSPYDLRGFASFRKHFPGVNIAGTAVICAAENVEKVNGGTMIIPWWTL
jgi:predicted AAA+ superfamily ATPase